MPMMPFKKKLKKNTNWHPKFEKQQQPTWKLLKKKLTNISFMFYLLPKGLE
jgi:hypothetical protein